jgi:hypothetical protein
MKLRRPLPAAAAAVAAAVVPAAFLTATAAHADPGSPTAPPASTAPATPTTAPGTPPPDDAAPCGKGYHSLVGFTLRGVPATITAGSGWHTFTETAANTSASPLGAVDLWIKDGNGQASENGDLQFRSELEWWDAAHSRWLSAADQGEETYDQPGTVTAHITLGAHESRTVKFRVDVHADATPGDGYFDTSGSYLDPRKQCRGAAEATGSHRFRVVAAGASAGSPTPGAGPSGGAVSGSGTDASPTPRQSATAGDLAETGASSALPWIATAAGVAVMAGAGTVVLVRRRRDGSGAV